MAAPTAPAPGHLRAILINNNAPKTKDPKVDLILSAQHATEMLIGNDEVFTGSMWEPYITAKEWLLSDTQIGPGFGDNSKTVYIKFRSTTLQETSTYTASIVLDTTPPSVGSIPILINSGALRTENRNIILTFDVIGATFIEIFNEDELENIQGTTINYDITAPWILSPNNGHKTVYVVFSDDIGNRTSFFSATIILTQQQAKKPVITQPTDGLVTTDHFVNISGVGDPEAIIQITLDGYGEGYGYGS